MTKEEFAVIAKAIKTLFPKESVFPNNESLTIWYSLLKDIDYQTATASVQKYALTNKFPPTVADIRELAVGIEHGTDDRWSKGFESAAKAIRKYGMYREREALDSLDDVTAEVVRRLGYKELCVSENQMADRGNFRMVYEQLAKDKADNDRLPDALKLTIKAIRANKLGDSNEQKKIAETETAKALYDNRREIEQNPRRDGRRSYS